MEQNHYQDHSLTFVYNTTVIVSGAPAQGVDANGNPCPACQLYAGLASAWPPRNQQELDAWIALLRAYPTDALVVEYLRGLPAEDHTCPIGANALFGGFAGDAQPPYNQARDPNPIAHDGRAQMQMPEMPEMQQGHWPQVDGGPFPQRGFAGDHENGDIGDMDARQANPLPFQVPENDPDEQEMDPFDPIVPEENVLLPLDNGPPYPVVNPNALFNPVAVAPDPAAMYNGGRRNAIVLADDDDGVNDLAAGLEQHLLAMVQSPPQSDDEPGSGNSGDEEDDDDDDDDEGGAEVRDSDEEFAPAGEEDSDDESEMDRDY